MHLKSATINSGKDNGVSLLIRIMSLTISLLLFFASSLARIGIEGGSSYGPLAVSICLIVLPGILTSITALPESIAQITTLIFFLVLGLAAITFDMNLSFVLLITSAICVLSVFRELKLHSTGLSLKATLPYVALGLTMMGLTWTQDYMNPLYPEAFAAGSGFVHTDTLFHAALTSNIKTYLSASTGLYGLEPMAYHHGAHYLLAAYSKLCEMDVLQFYSLGFPVIFVPLFVKTLLDAALSGRKAWSNTGAIVIGGIVLFFIINGFYNFGFGMRYLLPSAVNTHFLSQSYCISLILTFIFISIFKPLLFGQPIFNSRLGNAILILLIPVFVFVIGYTKVSTALVLLATFLYLILRKRLFFQRWILVAAAASLISLYGLFELTIEREGSNFQIQPGSYYKHFVQGSVFIHFLAYYAFFALLALIVILPDYRSRGSFMKDLASGRYIILELISVAAFTGMLPGLLFYIDGGSAYYFLDIQYWFTAVALVYYIPGIVRTSGIFKSEKFLSFAYAVVTIVLIAKASLEVFSFVRKNVQIRTTLVYGNAIAFKQLIKSEPSFELAKALTVDITKSSRYQEVISRSGIPLLDSIRTLPHSIRSRAVIYCEDPEQLGEFLDCSQAIFYTPALAEIALINGLYWRDNCYVIDEYGIRPYASYPSKVQSAHATDLAMRKGFKYLIYMNFGKGTYNIEDLHKVAGNFAP